MSRQWITDYSVKKPVFLEKTGFWWIGLALVAGLALATWPLKGAGAALIGTLLGVAILIQPHRALYLLPFAVPLGSRIEFSIGGFNAGALEAILVVALAAWLARAVVRDAEIGPPFRGRFFGSGPLAPESAPLACPPRPPNLGGWGGGESPAEVGVPPKIGGSGGLIRWGGRLSIEKPTPERIEPPPLLLPFLLFLGAISLSLTAAQALEPALKETVKWVEALVAYLLVARQIGTRRQAGLLVASILLAGTAEAALGLSGAFLHIGPPSYAILGGRFFRASGDFGQPNPFGGYMNMVWPLAGSLLVFLWMSGRHIAPRGRSLPPGRPQGATLLRQAAIFAALGFILAIFLAALALSWSRGAWMGAAAGGIVIMFGGLLAALRAPAGSEQGRAIRRRAVAIVTGSGVLLILILLAGVASPPSSVQGRIESITEFFGGFDVEGVEITDENFATVERVAHWVAAWRMWADHFWLGVGMGNYPEAYPRYRLTRWEDPLGHAHNYYFNIGAEAGLVGLLAYLVFVSAAAWHTVRVASRSSDWLSRGFAMGVLAVLLATAVHNLFDNLYVHGMAAHLGLLLGGVTALERIHGTNALADSSAVSG